jgi:hypothetical protein
VADHSTGECADAPYLDVSEDSKGVVYATKDGSTHLLSHDGQTVAPGESSSPCGQGSVSP